MRERAALFGGRLEAGRPGVASEVAAWLPWSPSPGNAGWRPDRILLVDDQRLVRTGFRMIVADEPDIEVVGEAADERAAVEAVELRPDVVVMDLRMPIMDGVEATRRLCAIQDTASRVLIPTTFDADDYVIEALRAGASGFLLKDVTPTDFVHAIRVVAAGELCWPRP